MANGGTGATNLGDLVLQPQRCPRPEGRTAKSIQHSKKNTKLPSKLVSLNQSNIYLSRVRLLNLRYFPI